MTRMHLTLDPEVTGRCYSAQMQEAATRFNREPPRAGSPGSQPRDAKGSQPRGHRLSQKPWRERSWGIQPLPDSPGAGRNPRWMVGPPRWEFHPKVQQQRRERRHREASKRRHSGLCPLEGSLCLEHHHLHPLALHRAGGTPVLENAGRGQSIGVFLWPLPIDLGGLVVQPVARCGLGWPSQVRSWNGRRVAPRAPGWIPSFRAKAQPWEPGAGPEEQLVGFSGQPAPASTWNPGGGQL